MLLGYIWLLGTFVNSSCDIIINVNIVQNCCRNLAVRGLKLRYTCKQQVFSGASVFGPYQSWNFYNCGAGRCHLARIVAF